MRGLVEILIWGGVRVGQGRVSAMAGLETSCSIFQETT